MSNPNLVQSVRGIPAAAVKWLTNPVVVRELRAQMRSVKSFAFIGGYLLLLSLIAVAGYAAATGQSLNPLVWNGHPRNIVDAQANLGTFRAFIFGALALMVTVIAPALTSASIVSERQRQSFDLLVTTPLTGSQLLVGKLLSSVAFLGFLMLLSLPATALCVILGGATPGDVLRYYVLLAVDGIVLSAIGLYFSSTARVPLSATVWTTLGLVGFLLVTFMMAQSVSQASDTRSVVPVPLEPFLSLAWLNPLVAILPVANGEGTTPMLLLRLAVFFGVAALLVRLLLAAAVYRLGLFGAASALTVRRLSLLLTAIVVGFLSNALAKARPEAFAHFGTGSFGTGSPVTLYGMMIVGALMIAVPFLPGLFVPASVEDAPPGMTSETASEPARDRLFNPRRLFYPEHSGAFPWYVAFVLTITGSILAGVLPYPTVWATVGLMALAGAVFLLGIGFLLWTLSRLAGSLSSELSPSRGLAFALYAAALGLPTLALSLTGADWQSNPLATLWLLSPVLYKEPLRMLEAFVREGTLAASLGVIVFLVDQGLRARAIPIPRLTRTAE